MPASVIRRQVSEEATRMVIACGGARYVVTLQAVHDANGRRIGYRSELRRNNEIFESEEAATGAALAMVERLAGEPGT